jgi:serine/threonine-protein kinase
VSALLPTDAGFPPHARWLAGRYEFLDELGRGGTSVVYRARDRETGRTVAIKVVDRAADDGDAACPHRSRGATREGAPAPAHRSHARRRGG